MERFSVPSLEELARFGQDHGTLAVRARETAHRLHRIPIGDDEEFGLTLLRHPHHIGMLVSRVPVKSRQCCLQKILERVRVLRLGPGMPHSADHGPSLALAILVFEASLAECWGIRLSNSYAFRGRGRRARS